MERGAAVLFLPVVFGVVAVALLVIATTARVQASLGEVQWAADAAALAGASVADPVDRLGAVLETSAAVDPGSPTWRAAGEVAEANGARLVGARLIRSTGGRDGSIPLGPVLVVEVERNGIRAEAAALRQAVESL
jgi:hypothetical protein